MRAYLLAGGLGERLRPLTLDRPKCLVTVGDEPLLEHWLRKCAVEGIEDVLVNVSQFPELVAEFLSRREGLPRVTLVAESRPLGSAATVTNNRDFVAGEGAFWVFYSDTLIEGTLKGLEDFHSGHDGVLTMGLFHAPDPRAAGIVTLGERGRILHIEEKPIDPKGDLANAGVYLARPALFDMIPEPNGLEPLDFGLHVLPRLNGQMFGTVLSGDVIDVGTHAALERVNATWQTRGTSRTLRP